MLDPASPPPPAPPWAPPKAPIPPQRLVKLANALGVPIPAVRTQLLRSHSDALSPPPRSPTPSTQPSSTSRYLLHVIPPLYLPHRSEPPSASGYHTQYRRGILVPVYANFQSQLAAIAKEYALPGTTGMILYLVTSGPEPHNIEPGPRISEEIWKHIWTRVVRAEQVDNNILPQSPQLYRLRPLLSAGTPKPHSTSSGVSSTSDLRLNSKSPSLASTEDPDTSDTSSPSQASLDEAATKANAFVLPGLNSPSLIPVLAKVEFDIDRQKAGWYEPWLRSKKLNRAKRSGRRKGKSAGAAGDEEQSDESLGKQSPLSLLTGTKGASIPRDSQLSDVSDPEGNSDAEDVTERVSAIVLDAQKAELSVPRAPSPVPNTGPSNAYLKEPTSPNNTGGSDEELEGYTRIRSPEESEKRVGAIFDDLDLGLDPSGDFDDYDLNDRRRSQLLMKAKLDEIERTMLQLSPRALKSTSEEDPIVGSPSKSTHLSPSPKRNGDARPPTLRRGDDALDSQNISQAWPAVPYTTLKGSMNLVQTDGPLSPPRLAVNGVSAAAPLHYIPLARSSSLEVSSETQQRKKELEEEYSFNLADEDSPIPLSPDPFNRYPSAPEPLMLQEIVPVLKSSVENGVVNGRTRAATVASRFSVDSTDEAIAKPNNRTTLMSMKSIKRLWRRSDKSSQSNNSASVSSTGRASPNHPPARPERPPQEELDLPPMPDIAPSHRISPTPGFVAAGHSSVDQLSVPPPKGFASPTHLEGLHFDQDSSYHTRLPPVRYSPKPPSPPLPAQVVPEPRKSILKWRSKSKAGSISQAVPGAQESRASIDQSRPPSSASSVAPNGTRGRQSSMSSLSPGHCPGSSLDIPPSPRIPEHFLNNSRQAMPLPSASSDKQQSNGKLPRSSTDSQATSEHPTRSTRSSSPRHSTSSQDSHERLSFDVSQFEIISPKTTALTYPYHGLDHE